MTSRAPEFLSLAEVVAIHRDQIVRYSGRAGIRDRNALSAAIAAPAAAIQSGYLLEDVFEMAAAYLFHIVRGHPFVDGNKRTGLVSAMVFLALNEITIKADDDVLETLVLRAASGKISRAGIAEFLRSHEF